MKKPVYVYAAIGWTTAAIAPWSPPHTAPHTIGPCTSALCSCAPNSPATWGVCHGSTSNPNIIPLS